MDEQEQFFRLLKEIKRKLWLQEAIRIFYQALMLCASLTLLWIGISRFLVTIYLDTKIALTIVVSMVVFVTYFFVKKPTNRKAAKKFDQQGLDDRVMTALDFTSDTTDIAKLQRKDTLKKMKQVLPELKQEKVHWLRWNELAISLCILILAGLGILFPNDVMESAKDREKEQEIVKENKEKVEQFAEKHTEKVGAEAEEKLDKLLEEVKEEKKAEELREDLLRAEKQLNELKKQSENSEEQLNQLKNQLQADGLTSLAEAVNQRNPEQIKNQMAALKDQLKSLSEEQLQALQKQLQSAAKLMGLESEEIAQDQLTKQQLDQLLSQMEDKMKDLTKSAGNESKLATAQSDIQQIAQSLNQQMTTAGLGAPSSLAFSGGSPSTGSSSGTGGQSDQSAQEGQAGTGSGNGSSTDGGSGNEPGSGSGSGSGSGNGSGSGSGSGTGTGSGSSSGGNGASLGAGNHNLTVPKQLNGQENQEIDKGELGAGESEQQIDPNAPILPGEVRSYGEVFEQYENTYRQAIQRNNYPDHLQEMIKDYFSDIKPTKGAN